MNHQQLIKILIVVDEEEEDGGGGVGVGEEDHPTWTIDLVSCNFKSTNSFHYKVKSSTVISLKSIFTNFSQNDK